MGHTQARSAVAVMKVIGHPPYGSTMKLSIIINNYNYGSFVGQAITSALAIDWPEKEIIVIDDGSTDDSRDMIALFGNQIIAIFTANGGQNRACNAGFERSAGDVVIFLDADDTLFPSVAKVVNAAMREGVSKVQYSLVLADTTLRSLGSRYPRYRCMQTPEMVRERLKRSGGYISSPTSGNAWAKSFLSQVFPLPVREGPPRSGGCQGDYRVPNADLYLSTLAPFFGDVVTIDDDEPQGFYRVHGQHNYTSVPLKAYERRMIVEHWECARHVNELLARLKIAHDPINVELDETFMKYRLIYQRLVDRPTIGLFFKYLRAVWRYDAPIGRKAKWFLWSLVVVGGPRPASLWAIHMRVARWV
jgi:glycosyltransferase involved in cell wall biosynthesis